MTSILSKRTIKEEIPSFIKALMKPEAYPHYVKEVKLLETHISWILLTGKYAYKIKKSINLGFFVATDIKHRLMFCEEELRLNRRLSPKLYIGLVSILGPPQLAKISPQDFKTNESINDLSQSQIIEVAVKMHEFPQSQLLNNYIKEN